MNVRHQIRRAMRHYRRTLTPRQQYTAAQALCRRLACHAVFIHSKHIAFYLPNDGEIDPRPLLERALKMGKKCYLPALAPRCSNTALRFVRYQKNTPMQCNDYGIAEPHIKHSSSLPASQLNLVLMPLVAFDTTGNRLGMGGGYYDRSFAFKQKTRNKMPYLLGLAHQGQQYTQLPKQAWDIPLAAIVTDQQWINCAGKVNKRVD